MLERSCVEVAGSDEDLTLHEWLIGWGAILLFLTLVVWASYWILLFLTWLLGNALPWMFWGDVDGDRFAHLAWDRRVSFLAVRGTCGFDGAESTDLVHRSGSATRLESLWALSVSD